MARNLKEVREAIEPQQVQAHRRRGKCYLGLSHQKKVTLSERYRMLCNDYHATQRICTASTNPRYNYILYHAILFITMRYL